MMLSMKCTIISVFMLIPCIVTQSDHPLVLVVALDGFRYDYITESRAPNLFKLANEGVWAKEGMISEFFSVTMPNFVSMSTGLHTENHGIIGNEFYDTKLEKQYDYFNEDQQHGLEEIDSRNPEWYLAGHPIWALNNMQNSKQFSKQQRRSACFKWPSCDAQFPLVAKNIDLMPQNVLFEPVVLEYGTLATWDVEFDRIIDWFTNPNYLVNLAMMYIGEPDHTQHEADLDSAKVLQVVHDTDAFIGHVRARFEKLGLWHRVNLVVVSDHGHTKLQNPASYVDLSGILGEKWLDMEKNGLSLVNRVNPNENWDDVFEKFQAALRNDAILAKKLKVYRKRDFPDNAHYKNSYRVGEILLEMEPGYFPYMDPKVLEQLSQKPPSYGHHFYNSSFKDMRGIFVAHGPALKKGSIIELPFANVNVFPILCKLLEIQCPPNNGSIEYFENVMFHSEDMESSLVLRILLIFCLVAFPLWFLYSNKDSEEVVSK